MQEPVEMNPIPNTSFRTTATRKIGNTTFLVTTSFKEGPDGDIIDTFARLAQYDADRAGKTS